MNKLAIENGVWFVYDGDCPICSHAARALRIRQALGELHLLNAREQSDHPLMREICERHFDLDEGMVIYHQGEYFHGESALQFMAKHGDRVGWFNWFNKSLFWSKGLSKWIYPWMRGVRNWLIRQRDKSPIDNLDLSSSPIFKPIFGSHWCSLPPVIKKHYANRPYGNDRVVVEGRLNIQCRWPMFWLKPFYRLMRTIPVINAQDVAVTVSFDSDPNSKAFQFNRLFHFTDRAPYAFQSAMYSQGDGNVVEQMAWGLRWLMRFEWSGEKVLMHHRGYALKLLSHVIPLPLNWLLGTAEAEEIPVDDDHFDMCVTMRHPLLGKLYSYYGRFKVTQPL